MKVLDLIKNVIITYEMQVSMPPGVNESYTRHGTERGEWTYDVSYDIMVKLMYALMNYQKS